MTALAASVLLLLANDVQIIPVSDLPVALRRRLGSEPDDYIISRPGSRSPSLVVDEAAAALITLFREPRSLVAAVLSYSQSTRSDPHRVLDDAFVVLQHLLRRGLLIPNESNSATALTPTFASGDVIEDCTVEQVVQTFEDTEVYRVRSAGGSQFALKLVRPKAAAAANVLLHHEAAVLRYLRGSVGPQLQRAGLFEGRRYVLTTWHTGVDARMAADVQARADPGTQPGPGLRNLCTSILRAYARLHACNLLHGDVHPRNILVDPRGAVTILDFALSHPVTGRPSRVLPPRRGVSFYFEPECAIAQRQGLAPVRATAAGEQYAVAALLYLLLTGTHYIDFQLDEELLRQIAEEPPVPLMQRGVSAWPEGEQVLVRALQKAPAQRFESVSAFAEALESAATRAAQRSASASSTHQPEAVLQDVVTRVGAKPAEMPLRPPTCSVHYGAAGIGYMFYRLACLRDDPALLALADVWLERAMRESHNPEGFASPELIRTNTGPGPISVLHTISGVHFVRVLISLAQNDASTARRALHAFCVAGSRPYANLDATLGRSSIVLACSNLLPAVPTHLDAERRAIVALGNAVYLSVREELTRYDMLTSSDPPGWLGMAHGWAGILYAAHRWLQTLREQPPPMMADRLRELGNLAETAGRGVCWPRQSGVRGAGGRPSAGWCHGSAGYVHLWTLAHAMYGDPFFASLAEKAAWHAAETPSPMGGSLCCGYGGQAYALLAMYRASGDKRWWERAMMLSARAAGNGLKGLRPNSLYAGDVGIGLLTAEMQWPELARMPLFEAEDWPSTHFDE